MFNNKKNTAEKDLNNSSNIIGEGTSLDGNLATAGNLRIEGKVVGSIHTKSKVVLGDTSEVEGNIIAQNAEIGGKVQGALCIAELLILKTTAAVYGDINTSKLVIEEGAQFNGKCNMGEATKANKAASNPSAIHPKNSTSIVSTTQQNHLYEKREKAH